MLKIVFYCLLIVLSLESWAGIVFGLFLGSFLYSLFCPIRGLVGELGVSLGVDWVGYVLIVLRFWIMGLCVLASQKIKDTMNFPRLFLLVRGLLLVRLVLTFSSMDYLLFYVCFESSLIPTIILILGWGYQPERLQAGVYMLFYTLFASLPLLVSLMSLYNVSGRLVIGLVRACVESDFMSLVWYFCTVFAFTVKLPMFIFHLWLPKAHVEAPVAGSMVLAGVLLKLGGYGLLRTSSIFIGPAVSFSWV